MKKHLTASLALTLLMTASLLGSQEHKKWTFFTYIAGDNSLAEFVQGNLNDMKLGANDNVHVLAFVSTNNPTEGKVSKKLIITKDGITQDGPSLPNLDSGDYNTVLLALDWAYSFPSDHFLLDLWDHGSGGLNPNRSVKKPFGCLNSHLVMLDTQRGACFDDTTGNYLTDRDVATVLQTVTKKYSKPSIVAFDACLMAGIEIATTVAPYADFYVASEQTIPGTGYPYDKILANLSAITTPADLAKIIVQAYDDLYKGQVNDYTLSAINLSAIPALAANVNQLGKLLTKPSALLKNILKQASNPNHVSRFEVKDYMDLKNFYTNLAKDSHIQHRKDLAAINAVVTQGLPLFDNAIIAQVHGPQFPAATGLSIYYPLHHMDPSYPNLLWSTNSDWTPFLKSIL